MSQVKNRLFIGNIPKDLKLDDIQAVLNKEVRGRHSAMRDLCLKFHAFAPNSLL